MYFVLNSSFFRYKFQIILMKFFTKFNKRVSQSVTYRELRVHVFLDPDPDLDPKKTKFLDPARTRTQTRMGPDQSFFPLLFGIFYIHDQVKDQDFNYLLVALKRKVNIKLFLVVFPHIVLFKFEVKYKPGLKENLDMDPDPDPGPIKMKKLDADPGSIKMKKLDPDPRPGRARVWKDPQLSRDE